MKKLLLFLSCVWTGFAFSQATATQPADLYQCGNEVFDLTAQTPVILGVQSPSDFSVTYYVSQADADNESNAIATPSFYIAPQFGTVYARVDSALDASFATTSFLVSWEMPFEVPDVPDVTACGSYTLLPVFGVNYTADMAGTIAVPSTITESMTVYRHLTDFPCSIPSAFEVTIIPPPVALQFPDFIQCEPWIPFPLPAGQSFHFASGGAPETLIPPGMVITSVTPIYVFAESGTTPNCTDESSFMVIVLPTPVVDQLPDVYACGSYVLPALNSGNYYTGPNGTGTMLFAGDVITSSQQIYIYFATPTLPPCIAESAFFVTIGTLQVPPPPDFVVCDDNGDGFATFDLESKEPEIVNGQPAWSVTFHETMIDAEIGTNSLVSPYVNITPNQTIYIRVTDVTAACSGITTMKLVASICNSISGVVRFDADMNGCTESDPPMGNILVSDTVNGNVQYAVTDADGYYSFSTLVAGSHSVAVMTEGYGNASPLIVEVLLDTEATADFCVVPAGPTDDLQVTIVPLTVARPGFPFACKVILKNVGTTTQSGTLTLNYTQPQYMTFSSSVPAVSGQSAGMITFDYSALAPWTTYEAEAIFQMALPPTVQQGNFLQLYAFTPLELPDATPYNNSSTFITMVINSYDPNDKTVLESGFAADDTQNALHYVVRFQNTGTADAVNVHITDQLDANLDWTTFRTVAASHAFTTTMSETGLVDFRFDNINLPPMSLSDPDSQGFVAYEINLKSGLNSNDDIYNTANIFFDFNEAIVTNTVMTDLAELGVGENERSLFMLYPNPATQLVNIQAVSDFTVELYDVQGKKIMARNGANQLALDVSMLQQGLYFVKVTTDNASEVKKLLVR